MTQDNQEGSPREEAGGYGAPTAEQEMPGGDTRTFAEPREEEVFHGTDPGFEPVPRDPSSSPGQPVPGTPPAPNGIPDGSGTDLPDSKSPRDRDDDTFDAR